MVSPGRCAPLVAPISPLSQTSHKYHVRLHIILIVKRSWHMISLSHNKRTLQHAVNDCSMQVMRCVIRNMVSSALRTETAVCGDVRRITTVAFGLASAVVSRRSRTAATFVLQALPIFRVSSGIRGKATTTRWSSRRWRSGRITTESHDTVCSIMETIDFMHLTK